jgi:uncharacterized protein YndB with AHSA1/START domain
VEDQVTRHVRIEATPEAVWEALTDPRELAAWFGAAGTIDPRVGGAVRFRWPDGSERRGLVIELDPPRRLAFRWRGLRTSGAGPSAVEVRVVTFTLEPDRAGGRKGTRVTVTESNGILSADPPLAMAENG